MLVLSLEGAAFAAPAPPPTPAPVVLPPSVNNGVLLWQRGDWADAVAMWKPFAASGQPDAMYNLGQARKLGRGLPRDEEQARDWFRRAAEKGHRPAQANLGIMLFQLGEKPEALRWLRTAADAGEPRAQYVYGVASWNGDGLPRSLTVAYAFLARAADQGLAEARAALDRLVPRLTPVERANGWALASSMARGDGKVVPLSRVANPNPEIAVGPPPRAATAEAAPVPQTPSINPAALTDTGSNTSNTDTYRIQIGAYSRQDIAEADVTALKQSKPDLVSGLTPYFTFGNGLVRLQFGRFSNRAAAETACQRFQAAGRACLIVETG
jgi:cell division septation protein DedD